MECLQTHLAISSAAVVVLCGKTMNKVYKILQNNIICGDSLKIQEQWIKDNKTRGIKECKEIKSMTTKN